MLQGSVIGFGTNCMSGIYFIWQPDRWLKFSTPVCWVKPWSNRLASWKLGFTCDFVWPGLACTCIDLWSLWSRSNLHTSQCKFFTVWPPNASLFTSSTCDHLWVHLTRTLKRTYKPHHGPVTISWSQKTYTSRYFKIRLKGHSSQSIRLQEFTGTVVV